MALFEIAGLLIVSLSGQRIVDFRCFLAQPFDTKALTFSPQLQVLPFGQRHAAEVIKGGGAVKRRSSRNITMKSCNGESEFKLSVISLQSISLRLEADAVTKNFSFSCLPDSSMRKDG